MIPLVKDTIDLNDLNQLADWLRTNPRLTKGELTVKFEIEWSKWLGTQYSVFVNSGSSANFLMLDALIQSGKLKSNKVIVPAVSWVTTVAPIIQLGLDPILCDADKDNLGIDLEHLERLLKENEVGAVIIVHVLGVPNHMDEIQYSCDKYNVILLEDCCEAPGSKYKGKKVGTFGAMSSFSFYFGHHMSTIEGGMVCCMDEDIYSIVLSIRSHGWARDLPSPKRAKHEKEFGIREFESLYTFYYPGYNFRSTDLNAFLGLLQLKKLDDVITLRNRNYLLYKKLLEVNYWVQTNSVAYISNFSFGLIDKRRLNIVKKLNESGIETRPLICGSIGQQPFWIKRYGRTSLQMADMVHANGLYLPNNHQITKEEIGFVCNVLNSI